MATSENRLASERMLFDAVAALGRGDTRPWVEMFHGDGVMEFPYAPPGFPRRLEGTGAIAEYLRPYPELLSIERVTRRGVYHDGDVMVAEFAADIRVLATGTRVTLEYVGVITLSGGKVTLYRDYWDPLVVTAAMGGDTSRGLAAAEQRS